MSKRRPNFLIITTDEERFPPPYENSAAKEWRIKHTPGRQAIAANGMMFTRHYTAATACAPARATIYTGQYPSLHGVSQTPGMGKSSFDPAMFWLDPDAVPTMGHWFKAIGYNTCYRGKWHISDGDLIIPGTRTALMSNTKHGKIIEEKYENYKAANRLESFGWDGWIGPEPHGNLQANDGTVRDPGFADQVCRQLEALDEQARQNPDGYQPFVLVSSFVNPHDIVFSGIPWFDVFQKAVQAGKLPHIDPAPTAHEALESKPRAQKDYATMYNRFYMPQIDNDTYRQFYYWLIAEVDRHIARVYDKLQNCCFFDDTIVLFTSDHGEMLGAHGGLHQKWYNAYEEILRVPFIVSNPKLFPQAAETDALSSHIDILPTLLGLAGLDKHEMDRVANGLSKTHYEVQDLPGRDLSGLVRGEGAAEGDATVYFMSDDTVETGADMVGAVTKRPYRAVIQPNHLEAVVAELPGDNGPELWKYVRYFDNPRFVRGPGNQDDLPIEALVPPEFECYNLTRDPLEEANLLSPVSPEKCPAHVHKELCRIMEEQRQAKRKLPHNINPGSVINFFRKIKQKEEEFGEILQ